MIFFGDATRVVDPRDLLASIDHSVAASPVPESALEAHAFYARVFLDLAELATALADQSESTKGTLAATVRRLNAALLASARVLDASWRGDPSHAAGPRAMLDMLPVRTALPSGPLRIKRAEGYAYYALYPELYGDAAREAGLPANTCVIGLRSIGTSLAAMVAAACGAPRFSTLRPHGPPFDREVTLDLTASDAHAATRVAVVDEGPGLSGSSFLGTRRSLVGSGVDPERVIFFPSHENGPGSASSSEARDIWQKTKRHNVAFESRFFDATGRGRLANWIEDLTGPLVEPPRDLSGGAWRDLFPWRTRPPVFSMQERRKYRFHGTNGRFLAKFVGLGRFGEDQADLQSRLADAGFTAPLAGLRHGFAISPWIEGAPLETFAGAEERACFLRHLSRYLAFRARSCPAAGRPGADIQSLAHMARYNIARATGRDPAELPMPTSGELDEIARTLVPVRIDGRLQKWEWLRRPDGSFLKCDAIDHHASHDLVGCQDIAWDIAGASLEFDLTDREADALRRAVAEGAGRSVPPQTVALMGRFYAAFQIGLWTFARDGAANPADAAACDERIAQFARGALA